MRWRGVAAGKTHAAHRGDRGPDIGFFQQQVFGHRGNIPDAGVTGGTFAIGAGDAGIDTVDQLVMKGTMM